MVDLKELGEGLSLGGTYTLEHWIRADESGTFFAAIGEDGERLLIKLTPATDPGAETQLAAWQRSRHLRHSHLLAVRDAGRIDVAGADYIYGAFEQPDDVLATALEQGPLSEDDTSAVLLAALAALRYLHSQGMVHSAVDPVHVVAVDDSVKLATDSLREADDLEGHAEDVRQLGELVRSLRGDQPLSEPLATIVSHATEPDLGTRWTLAEIATAITPPPAPPAPVPVVQPVAPDPPLPPPAAVLPPPRVLAAPVRREPASPGGFPRWIFAGVAVLLFSILALNLRRKPEVVPPAAPAARSPIVSATPAAATPASAPVEPPLPVAKTPAKPQLKWRVIAFTYNSHDMAAKKAKQINDRWPELHATVLAANDRRGYFLVALGGPMKAEEATRLQRRARGLGLPRDTYVQNMTE